MELIIEIWKMHQLFWRDRLHLSLTLYFFLFINYLASLQWASDSVTNRCYLLVVGVICRLPGQIYECRMVRNIAFTTIHILSL